MCLKTTTVIEVATGHWTRQRCVATDWPTHRSAQTINSSSQSVALVFIIANLCRPPNCSQLTLNWVHCLGYDAELVFFCIHMWDNEDVNCELALDWYVGLFGTKYIRRSYRPVTFLTGVCMWAKERHPEHLLSAVMANHTSCWKWHFLRCQTCQFQAPITEKLLFWWLISQEMLHL